MKKNHYIIVLYDGVCLFCEGWVNFVLNNKIDLLNVQFIPLQKIKVKEALISDSKKEVSKDTIIVIDEFGYYTQSDASLKVMTYLVAPYNFLAKISLLIPLRFRDYVYNFVGKHRYKIWGKKELCMVPTGSTKDFFPKAHKEISPKLQEIFNKHFLMEIE